MSQNRIGIEVSLSLPRQGSGGSSGYDDDGCHRRTGTVWTASARIITDVIGLRVLPLVWAIAQLGWIIGPLVVLSFSFITNYTSALLADCYCCGDPIRGERNYTYTDAVHSNLGRGKEWSCGLVQYLYLFGVAIGYAIAFSISMRAIGRSNCFHKKDDDSPCHTSSNPYMIAFVVIEIILSQIPNFDQLRWLSIMAAVMSFTYLSIGVTLGIIKVAENGKFKGSLTGISIGTVTQNQKMWRSFQALGDIAFAYAVSINLIEIQDTIKSPPPEAKTMRKATLVSLTVITLFHLLCACMAYGAFGDMAPRHLLAGFEFFNPDWLVDIANAAIMIHLIGAYQAYSQPIFAFIEKHAMRRFADGQFITREIEIPVPGFRTCKLYVFRLISRTIFVIVTTMISMVLPFFNEVIGLLGALGFWPLTVYFPIEMYIAQMKIPKWSTKWLCLQMLSLACLSTSLAAAAGSIAGVVLHLMSYKPFETSH